MPPFAEPLPDPLTCPACGENHVDWARTLADKAGTVGWRTTLRSGEGPYGETG